MTDRPKYLLCPGWVKSKADGQYHFIDEFSLARLYRVPMRDCLVEPCPGSPSSFGWVEPQGVVRLPPLDSGDYRTPA